MLWVPTVFCGWGASMRNWNGLRSGLAAVCFLCALVGLLTAFSGCGVTADQRVAWYEARLSEAEAVVAGVDAELGPAVERLTELEVQLEAVAATDPGGALAEGLREALGKMVVGIEAAQARRAVALEVMDKARAQLDALKAAGGGIGEELQAAGAVGAAVAPATGPAAPWVAIVSAALSGIGGLLLKRPGDVSAKEAKQREDQAWDDADELAFGRGFRVGLAEGKLGEPVEVLSDAAAGV